MKVYYLEMVLETPPTMSVLSGLQTPPTKKSGLQTPPTMSVLSGLQTPPTRDNSVIMCLS